MSYRSSNLAIESLFIRYYFSDHELILGNICIDHPRENINVFISKLVYMLNSYQSNFTRYPLHLVGDYNIDILKHLESASVQNCTNLMFDSN